MIFANPASARHNSHDKTPYDKTLSDKTPTTKPLLRQKNPTTNRRYDNTPNPCRRVFLSATEVQYYRMFNRSLEVRRNFSESASQFCYATP